VVVVGLLAYPLSAGPATWVIGVLPKGAAARYIVGYYAFYQPLFWICEKYPPLDRIMSSYVELGD